MIPYSAVEVLQYLLDGDLGFFDCAMLAGQIPSAVLVRTFEMLEEGYEAHARDGQFVDDELLQRLRGYGEGILAIHAAWDPNTNACDALVETTARLESLTSGDVDEEKFIRLTGEKWYLMCKCLD